MKDMKDTYILLSMRSPSKRVLVHMVTERPRPYFSVGGCLSMHRPADWEDIGLEAWEAERDRRAAIHRIMTIDERTVFEKYCRLRDE